MARDEEEEPVMFQRHTALGKVERGRRGFSLLMLVATMALTLTTVLSACAPDANHMAAQQNKAKLDHELQHVRQDLGIPDSMLAPIEKQEQSIASGESGWGYNYQNAASNYTLLYTQLIGTEQTASQTLRQQLQRDLQALTVALNTRRGEHFSEIQAYQVRLDKALADFNTAQTPGDYVKVDMAVRQQTVALNSLGPAYQKLQDFKALLRAVRSAGINTSLAELEYNQDVQTFREAASADRYQTLASVIDGQIMQLMADQTETLPYIGSTMLASFKARIELLKQYGENAGRFQKEYDSDVQMLGSASKLADYLTLAQLINKQTSEMNLPLVRGQARADLRVLAQLISDARAMNPLTAYEYANESEGIGDVQQKLDVASQYNDYDMYQTADNAAQILTANLRALLDNLHDGTPAGQPHQTDLQLMQHFGIMSGKNVVVSLREQTARFYDNGKLVYWSYVTTGRPEAVSPPGLHYAMEKDYHIEFSSSAPKGSPLWYGPTKINYAVLYADVGYFLHDAWWRLKFGPGSNLPHADGLAFNGGSHGCINFPEDNMAYVYQWTDVGDPIIVY
jgi:hypothetical protein